MGERGRSHKSNRESEPAVRSQLPPGLAEFLADREVACLTHATNLGTVYVIKVPGAEIRSVQGRVPIQLRHELYEHPAAPVIRTVITIFDRSDRPLALETFCNVADEDQRNDFVALAAQTSFLLLFYDEQLTHQLTKQVGNMDPDTITEVLDTAERARSRIPAGEYE